jgi:hypothetical protein
MVWACHMLHATEAYHPMPEHCVFDETKKCEFGNLVRVVPIDLKC